MEDKKLEAVVETSETSVHEDMIKIVNVFNGLPSKEKEIIMAMLGEGSVLGEEGQIIEEIISYWPPDYKAIFIELIKNNAKLSWGTMNKDEGTAWEGAE